MVGDILAVVGLGPPGKGSVPVLKLADSRPDFFRGGSELTEDLIKLINFRVSREKRTLGDHFDKDGSNGPDIDRGSIGLRSQQDLRRTVPESDNLMGKRADGRAKGTGETEISKLQASISANQNILWLHITMHDTTCVAKGKSPNTLKEVGLDQDGREQSIARLHVLFQILVEEFKDEVKLSILLDAIFQLYNVLMFEFPQKTNLTKSRGRNTFVFHLQTDSLQSDNFIGVAILCFVNYSVRSLSKSSFRLFNLLIAVSSNQETIEAIW
jgi:hypothetical protein